MKLNKNIHVLPTDKPSRLYYHSDLKQLVLTNKTILREVVKNQNIYINSDEEIKKPCWCWDILQKKIYWVHDTIPEYPTICNYFKKIILTTDQDLIKEGVQAIDDEFLEWICKNPSCEEVEIILEDIEQPRTLYPNGNHKGERVWIERYKIILPKEEPNQKIELVNGYFPTSIFNKQEKNKCNWETIGSEYSLQMYNKVNLNLPFFNWLKENYNPPIKKDKQKTLEEALKNELDFIHNSCRNFDFDLGFKAGGLIGAKWHQDKICDSEIIQKIRATKSDAEARRIIRTV